MAKTIVAAKGDGADAAIKYLEKHEYKFIPDKDISFKYLNSIWFGKYVLKSKDTDVLLYCEFDKYMIALHINAGKENESPDTTYSNCYSIIYKDESYIYSELDKLFKLTNKSKKD